jgi:hypothetical protein
VLLELGLNKIFFGLNKIDFWGFKRENPKNQSDLIQKKSDLILIPTYRTT